MKIMQACGASPKDHTVVWERSGEGYNLSERVDASIIFLHLSKLFAGSCLIYHNPIGYIFIIAIFILTCKICIYFIAKNCIYFEFSF
jgi:hypothetical protein